VGDLRTAGRAGDEGTDLLERHRGLVAVLAALAPFLLVGGVVGVAGGLGAGVLTWRALEGREPTAVRRRRERVLHDLPAVVDLLAVTLAAGAAPSTALAAVGAAVEGPVVTDLQAAERSLALGRDPARVWRELGERPGLAPLGRAMVRAIESGAAVSDALQRLAEDLHASARLEAETKARAVGVRAAAPLGLCLLPAFVLIGVVPLVGSAVAALLAG
jgi:Flp pilus assembly protein TadB